MRTWQVERRKRTRHLIELGGLVVKAGIVDLTGDDRATILGALLWMADKLQSDQGEQARSLWADKGKRAFNAERAGETPTASQVQHDQARHRAACRANTVHPAPDSLLLEAAPGHAFALPLAVRC